jgi:hypothetical protein
MPGQERLPRVVTILALVLSIAVIIVHAGLIPTGQWEGDEYFAFAWLRVGGFQYFLHVIVEWSPRPFSEALKYLYYEMIMVTGSQMLVPFLMIFWVMLPACAILGFWQSVGSRLNRGLMSLSVVAMFLLVHPIAEMFYWPLGAAAYVPSLSAITFVTFVVVRGGPQTPRGKLACMVAMLVAAGSAEVGAMFTLCFAALLCCIEVTEAPRKPMRLVWCILPLIACIPVFALLLLGRVARGGPLVQDNTFYHHIVPSLVEAVSESLRGLENTGGLISARGKNHWGLVIQGLMFLGLVCCMRRERVGGYGFKRLGALAVALCATIYLSTAAAYYQFGENCCERHDTFRSCLVILLGVTLAGLAAGSRWTQGLRGWRTATAGPVLIAVSVVILFVARIPALASDYRTFGEMTGIRVQNWEMGTDPARSSMTFLLFSSSCVGPKQGWATGEYARSDHPPWYIDAILEFFGKDSVRIVQVPQSGACS